MILTALLVSCLASIDDPGLWLERLRAASGVERAQAEIWLGLHLVDGDLERVVDALSVPDAEVEQRLVNALGASDRTLGLAAALAARSEPGCAGVGREALRERILAWDPGAEEAPRAQNAVLSALREEGGAPTELRLFAGAGAVRNEFEDLARRFDPSIELVLDPDLDAHAPSAATKDPIGPPASLLTYLLRRSGASLVGFGVGEVDFAASSRALRHWLLVVPAQAELGTNALRRITSWCTRSQDAREPAASRSACACALGQCGWSAPLAWFERRWRATADECALDGLVAAAGRGRVAGLLYSSDMQRALYARLHERLSGAAPSEHAAAQACADALGNAGPSGELALEGWDKADPRERWLLLAILERQGRAPPRALQEIERLLSPDARACPPPLALQALRTRAALAPSPVWSFAPSGTSALIAWAERRASSGAPDELIDAWFQSAPVPPAQWRDPSGASKPGTQAERALACVAWLARGDLESAARHALSWMEAADSSIESVARIVRGASERLALRERERFAQLLRAGNVRDPAARALLLLLAHLDEHPAAEIAQAWISAPAPSRAEFLALGALAAGEHGAAARARLCALVAAPTKLSDELDRARDDALRAAVHELRRARAEDELESFVRAVREAASGAADARVRLYASEHWPLPGTNPPEPLVPLVRGVRRLELAGF